jgi:hypothetical protein
MQTGSILGVVIIETRLAGLCLQTSFAIDESYDAWLGCAAVGPCETRQV